jgi:hypothetical protein
MVQLERDHAEIVDIETKESGTRKISRHISNDGALVAARQYRMECSRPISRKAIGSNFFERKKRS